MPLTGSDFTPTQLLALRVIADYINPGMTDQQVLAWATAQGADGAMNAARNKFVQKVQDDTDELRRQLLAQLTDALKDVE